MISFTSGLTARTRFRLMGLGWTSRQLVARATSGQRASIRDSPQVLEVP